MLEDSLRHFGFGRSIVLDKNGKVIAGNKTLEQAAQIDMNDVVIVEADGNKIIAVQRMDLDMDDPNDPRARGLAVFDNRVAQVSLQWDTDVIGELIEEGVDLSRAFSEEELELLLNPEQDDDDRTKGDDDEDAPGSLLKLLDVTVAEPVHEVKRGEVWQMGPHHLVISNALTEWAQFVPYLKEGSVLCPYAGPFVPLTIGAGEYHLVLVQSNTYIAAKMLDYYAQINGEDQVKKVTP